MKALIVYYSLEGNTDLVARKIAEKIGADVIRLVPEKEIPTGNVKKFIWGGKSAVFGERPKLTNEKIPVDEYDTVILGTPVWAGTFTPALMTFFSQVKFTGKGVYLFACHAGGGAVAEKCFAKMGKYLDGNTIRHTIDFTDPAKGQDSNVAEKIDAFCEIIMKNEK